ncbi:hypothetical protein BASA83_004252 [Batrachochytrium salamandrivorans]|nr:hypothetical protein BASA83_004252 [Batrachochytrium salamandrivorans]
MGFPRTFLLHVHLTFSIQNKSVCTNYDDPAETLELLPLHGYLRGEQKTVQLFPSTTFPAVTTAAATAATAAATVLFVVLTLRPHQLSEPWLLLNSTRFFLFPAALLIQLSVGSLYAWSGYNLPIEAYIFGINGAIDRNIASNIFYVAVGVFGITAALLGPWLERHGPMAGCLLGAVLFYVGNLVAGLGIYTRHIELVFFGYGVISGMGLGIAYISPVSPLQKWFPEARGIAAGVANGQVGLVGLPLTFVVLGSVYFVAMCLSAIVLRMPPPGYIVKGITIDTVKGAEEFERKPMVVAVSSESTMPTPADKATYLETTNITGLLVISKIQTICQNQFKRDADTAILINSLLGGANLLGRLVLPLISDLLPVIPAFLADQFGAKNVGATHGIILLAWATGAVIGGLIFTEVLKRESIHFFPDTVPIYNLNFYWILALVLVGFVLCIFIHTKLSDRRMPRAEGEILRIRFVNGRMIRFHRNGRVHMLTKHEEEEEWTKYLATISQ